MSSKILYIMLLFPNSATAIKTSCQPALSW